VNWYTKDGKVIWFQPTWKNLENSNLVQLLCCYILCVLLLTVLPSNCCAPAAAAAVADVN
jgi:hypothetical protein